MDFLHFSGSSKQAHQLNIVIIIKIIYIYFFLADTGKLRVQRRRTKKVTSVVTYSKKLINYTAGKCGNNGKT